MKILLSCCLLLWLLSCAGPPPPYHAGALSETGTPIVLQAVNGKYLRLNAEGNLVADATTLVEADTLLLRPMGARIFVLQKGDRFLRAHGFYNYPVNNQAKTVGFGERFMWNHAGDQMYLQTSSTHYIGLGDDQLTMVVQHYSPVGGSVIRRIDLPQ